MRKNRVACVALPAILVVAFAWVTPGWAASCIAGDCHKKTVSAKFLHGPVGAEQAGGEGCKSCHVPAGAACTATKAGQFKLKTQKDRLCLLCHERGTATQHTRTRKDCLSCHNPHQSELSEMLLRAGQGSQTQKK